MGLFHFWCRILLAFNLGCASVYLIFKVNLEDDFSFFTMAKGFG